MNAEFLFGPVPYEEAVDFLKGKPAVSRAVFDKLLPELKARAFTIAGVESMDVLQSCRDAISTLPAGGDWGKIKKGILSEISPWFVDPGADAETRAKQETAAARRAELLLRHHGNQAYAAGNYEMLEAQKDEFPFRQYLSLGDGRVRPSHAALDKVVLPASHEFWATHTPPWEWGCRCTCVGITEEDARGIREADAKRPPERRQVLDQSELDRLTLTRTIVRPADPARGVGGPTPFNVSTPKEQGKPGAFHWHPGDLRIPLDELKGRYDAPTWATFETWARKQEIAENFTVWDWLNSKTVVNKKGVTDENDEDIELRRSWLGWQREADPDAAKRAWPAGDRVGRELYGNLRASKSGPLQAAVASAEIAAVAGGRKPLYHELLAAEEARSAAGLGGGLPGGAVTAEREGHLVIYQPDMVRQILDSDPVFYRPNGESDAEAVWRAVRADENGELMGYGARTRTAPGSVRVRLFTADGHLISGFSAPGAAAELFARERALDYAERLDAPVRYLILK